MRRADLRQWRRQHTHRREVARSVVAESRIHDVVAAQRRRPAKLQPRANPTITFAQVAKPMKRLARRQGPLTRLRLAPSRSELDALSGSRPSQPRNSAKRRAEESTCSPPILLLDRERAPARASAGFGLRTTSTISPGCRHAAKRPKGRAPNDSGRTSWRRTAPCN